MTLSIQDLNHYVRTIFWLQLSKLQRKAPGSVPRPLNTLYGLRNGMSDIYLGEKIKLTKQEISDLFKLISVVPKKKQNNKTQLLYFFIIV